MGMEDATKKGQVQEFFCKKLQRGPRQPMAELVNVCEKAVLDMKDGALENVELKSMDWHLFDKSNLSLDRQERVLGAAEGEYEFAAVREALIKLFPDTIINPESHVTDRKANDRFGNGIRKPLTGRLGATLPMRLMHTMHKMHKRTRTPRRKSRVRKSQT